MKRTTFKRVFKGWIGKGESEVEIEITGTMSIVIKLTTHIRNHLLRLGWKEIEEQRMSETIKVPDNLSKDERMKRRDKGMIK